MFYFRPIGLSLIVLSLIAPLFWIFPLASRHDNLALFSQYLGMVALISMAWTQFIATRFRSIEVLFGGLDRSYVLHKWLGVIAILAVLLHDTIDADMKGLGLETLLSDLGETFGEISLYGLLILVVISIATFIPYHLWRWTHKFMGLFFLLGAIHFLLILKPFKNLDVLGLYVAGFCLLGIFSYAYRILPGIMRIRKNYTVSEIKTGAGFTSLYLRPKSSFLNHRAGQFAFLHFPDSVSKEPHPFTISSGPDGAGSLRFTIADLGDFTGQVLPRLKSGDEVRIEGPYGHFTRKKRGAEIWIAGGIGVTPFVSWVGELRKQKLEHDVTLYFCVKERTRAAHLTELESFAREQEKFKLVLVESFKGSRLNAEMVAQDFNQNLSGIDIYYCGPAEMRESLKNALVHYGMQKRRFYYEEFQIRSGIGLRKLSLYILGRLLPQQANKLLE